MPAISVVKIIFDHDQILYSPGEVISGEIEIKNDSCMKIRRMLVRIFGRAETCIEETSKSKRRDSLHCYNDSQTLLDHISIVWERGDNVTNASLTAGKHTFSFSYQLPKRNLPNSYQGGENHNIQYMVIVSIDKGWKVQDIANRSFQVLDHTDISRRKFFDRPAPLQVEKRLHKFLCCTTGPAKLSASIDFTAYYLGETIKIQMIELDNKTNKEIRGVKIKLMRNLRYEAKGIEKRCKKACLIKQCLRTVPPGESSTWIDETIYIPHLQLTITDCALISMTYALQIEAYLDQNHDLIVSFPIVIGARPEFNNLPSSKSSVSMMESPIYDITIPGTVTNDVSSVYIEKSTSTSNYSSCNYSSCNYSSCNESINSCFDQLLK